MTNLFVLIFLAALAGVAYPYIARFKRKHFAIAAAASFVGIGVTAPPPTPQELAEGKKKEEAEAKADQAQKDHERAQMAASEHAKVIKKAALGLEVPANYTKAEYGATFARVGAATFKLLNDLEPGAVYAAAESKSCDKVNSAAVSDQSKPNAAIWFVDCANEDRFMITQKQAFEALERFKTGKLALKDLDRSCTLSSVGACKTAVASQTATVGQLAAKQSELELVSMCDMALEKALVSPSSVDMIGSWDFLLGKGDDVVFVRDFDSENAFGATIRSQYRCTVNGMAGSIKRFDIDGPAGLQRVL